MIAFKLREFKRTGRLFQGPVLLNAIVYWFTRVAEYLHRIRRIISSFASLRHAILYSFNIKKMLGGREGNV